jgi:hypothetical protein
MKKVYGKMVPRNVSCKQKDYVYLSARLLEEAKHLEKIVTGDETGVFQYDPETKFKVCNGKFQSLQD